MEAAITVRMSVRPPARFTEKTDWSLWISRFRESADYAVVHECLKCRYGHAGTDWNGRREREPFKLSVNVASRSCGKQSGDEVELLRQQRKVYQEDFAVERREERLREEKENERLRLQADVTSLQLQLDRCRTELTHYSSETTRLAHQLKIR
eukprot:Em0002g1805a